MTKRWNEMTAVEKGSLTEVELNAIIDDELAFAGLAEIDEPVMPQIPSFPDISKSLYYKVGNFNIAFATKKQAEKFVELAPKREDYSYYWGSDLEYAEDVDLEIKPIELYAYNDLEKHSDILRVRKDAQRDFDSAKSQYSSNRREISKVKGKIRQEWVNAISDVANIENVKGLFDKYTALFKDKVGNAEAVAYILLFKAYDKRTIDNVFAHWGIIAPTDITSDFCETYGVDYNKVCEDCES